MSYNALNKNELKNNLILKGIPLSSTDDGKNFESSRLDKQSDKPVPLKIYFENVYKNNSFM